MNILAKYRDLNGADACAIELLPTGELSAEQQRQLHGKPIDRSAGLADWQARKTARRRYVHQRSELGNALRRRRQHPRRPNLSARWPVWLG